LLRNEKESRGEEMEKLIITLNISSHRLMNEDEDEDEK
jgi:hypothetical protein